MNAVNIFFLICCALFLCTSVSALKNIGKRREERKSKKQKQIVSDKENKTESVKDENNKESEKKKSEKEKNDYISILKDALKPVQTIIFLILIVIGFLDLTKIVDFGQLHGGLSLIGVASLVEALTVSLIVSRKKLSKTMLFFCKLFVTAVLLEVTVFQMPSYHTFLKSDIPETTLLPTDAQLEGSCENMGNYVSVNGRDEALLTYNNLDKEIYTLYVNLNFSEYTNRTELVLDITDETHYTYRYDIARSKVVKERDNTAYVACEFSGKVGTLRVKFTNPDDYSRIDIQSIVLNRPIPFLISWLRLLLIVLLGTFAYAIVNTGVMARPYREAKGFCRLSIVYMTVFMIFIASAVVYRELPDMDIKRQFQLDSGNQITKEIVDALESGQISLLEEPSQDLLNLENPYDWGMREDNHVNALWDHVMYDGKYYTYYGVAPVFLLFLPYHKLTGHYFSTNISILLFSIIGLIALALTYMAVIKRWFRKIPVGIVIAGMLILFSSCGIWYSVGRNIFYEISISSGFAFTTLGAYFLISSNILGKFKVSLVRIVLSSLFFGLAVLSRPTLAVYAICACIYFVYGLSNSGKTMNYSGKTGKKRSRQTAYCVCALLPLVCLGIFQMWYNNARFGSPFDFGIKYSLTINDFTHSQYHTHFVLIGLWHYIFSVPSFSTDYPFITTPFPKLDINGYYFSDVGNTSGIFFLAFPVFGYFLSGKVLAGFKTMKSKIQKLLLVGLPCVVMPLVIIVSIWESGYAVRYTADFSWQIVIGAFAVLFYLYQKSKSADKKKLFTQFMALSSVASFIINGVQIFNFTFPRDDYPALCDHLSQLFAFWK